MRILLAPATALIALSPAAAAAQEAAPEADAAEEAEAEADAEIVVTGQRPRGSVEGHVPPEQVLTPADVRAYGVSTIAELLAELAPQTGSGRGRGDEAPVVLLEGRRISSLREIRDIPTEAIARVDILPEEAALSYGYPANQRVVNIVLRRRFRAITAEVEGGRPTGGGSAAGEVDLNYLRITRAGRLNLDLEVSAESALTEAERDLAPTREGLPFAVGGNVVAADGASEIDPALSALAGEALTVAPVPGASPALGDFVGAPNTTDLGRYRTLRPRTLGVEGNAVLARTLPGDIAATANLGFTLNDSEALVGLPSVDVAVPADNLFSPFANDVRVLRYVDAGGALTRETRSRGLTAGFSANGKAGEWRWTLTGSYAHAASDTDTERGLVLAAYRAGVAAGAIDPFAPLPALTLAAPDRARSVSNTGEVEAVANGDIAKLPAGDVGTTLKLGVATRDLDSRSVRSGVVQTGDATRRSANAQVNLELPITSRRRGVLAPVGDLGLNLNGAVERLSDFGTLTTLGYGANWSPAPALRLLASMTHEEGAPSPQQLGAPVLSTPNVRVFDYVRGESVDVIAIEGGNPALAADRRDVFKLGANWRPLARTDLTLRADYTDSTIDGPISPFPAATVAIEAAFPDRFVRDPAGRLVQIDTRPVNFARSERRQLRWGFNLSLPVTGSVQRRVRAAREAGEDPRAILREAFGDRGGERRRGAEGQGDRPRGERGGGFGRGGRGGGGGFGGGRFQFSLFHTLRLADRIAIRDGLPELDLLDGDAAGSRGGQPRHEVTLRSGFTRDGIGLRVNADWQSATRVDGATPAETLRFGSLATIGLRAFADLGSVPGLARDRPWLRGARLSLRLDNLFDRRLRVTDANGATPAGLQPALLDPLGRSVRLELRKRF